jgi:pilus assembly protein CpaC
MMRESRFRVDIAWLTLLVFMLLFWLSPAGAQNQLTRLGGGAENSLTVPLYKSRVVALNSPAARVSVGNPDVADILILQSTQLYVLGKDLGTTNVLLWDRGDNLIGTVNVEVTHDLQSLKEKLFRLLPQEKIEVYSAQRNIVLSGRVSNIVNMEAAVRIANGYFTQIGAAVESETFELEQATSSREDQSVGEIINLMSVGGVQQVMLEVKVAEISRTELKRLDVRFNSIFTGSSHWNFGGVNGGATFPDAVFQPDDVRLPVFSNAAPFGPVIDEFAPNDLFISDKGLFASFLSENALFNLAFDAAKENGLAKILAEPTLVTQTGHEAQFLSGGEFPIPVPRGQNGTTIEFKEFGVGIRFLPVVLDSGHISLKLNISVSELVSDNSVAISTDGVSSTFLIPSLTTRSAQSTVELADGQTIGVAGLINENLREVVTKFPGLGSIPGLGALFRSQEFRKGQTELLILVTPHLAKPLVPPEIQLPTDDFVEPSEFGWYFQGKLEGRR